MRASDGHLGDIAAAVADGQLSHDDRDRALVHITWCAECRADVEAQRRAKAWVARLPMTPCPDELLARLTAIPRLSDDAAFALVQSPLATPAPPRPTPSARTFHRASLRRRSLSAALVTSASAIAIGVWATPAPQVPRDQDLVNAGGHSPSSYRTYQFANTPDLTSFGQVPTGYLVGRP